MALLSEPPIPLADIPIFTGSGVYALYYTGDCELYSRIARDFCTIPIYVGKAVPAGGRKGLVDQVTEDTPLWRRLQEHKESLDQVRDLDCQDFWVRYLVTIDVFIPLAERVMIRRQKPVWNVVVDGFGNHDPGARRRKDGQRPPWDELHPGRWWSSPQNMPTPSLVSAEESKNRIRKHFETFDEITEQTAIQLDISFDVAGLSVDLPSEDDDDNES